MTNPIFTITLKRLIEMEACKEGLKRFKRITEDPDMEVPVHALLTYGGFPYSDFTWLAKQAFGSRPLIKFSSDCAKLVAHRDETKISGTLIRSIDNWLAAPSADKRRKIEQLSWRLQLDLRNLESHSEISLITIEAVSSLSFPDLSAARVADKVAVYDKPGVDKLLREMFRRHALSIYGKELGG